MAATIRIKMMREEVELEVSDDEVTKSSIRHAFLLPSDAVVSLSYEVDGRRIRCRVNDAGSRFLLPDGWPHMQFFVESDKVRSRPATPMDQSQSSVPLYVPIETDDLIRRLEKYLLYEKIDDAKACFTVISTHYAVSFNHGSHKEWRSSPEEIQTSVTIRNQEGQEFQTQLVLCNADVDFVVVRSNFPLISEAPTICYPRKLERYILLGYPGTDCQALEGIFSSIKLDKNGRMRGSSGSQRGYSGGSIFNYKGELLGINVANESPAKFIGFNGQTTLNEVFNEVNAAFPSLSVIVPVYYLALGIQENFKFEQ